MCYSWTVDKIPNLKNRVAIVTGANSGLGFVCARELARKGAEVILACRNEERGKQALAKLKSLVPEGVFSLMLVDMGSLESVRAFAKGFLATGKPLDILLNNAGVMMIPDYTKSKDGFEMQLATNHLAPFLLTGLLLPALRQNGDARVVGVSSLAAWSGKKTPGAVDFVKNTDSYKPFEVYAETKLANLMFVKELARRYPDITAVAAHPGIAATNLWRYQNQLMKTLMQSGEMGAMPLLRAATDPSLKSGSYIGCTLGFRGAPASGVAPPTARDQKYAAEYWEKSVEATNMKY